MPYRGTSENLETLLAGRINAAADASGWAPQVQEGRLRLLCTWGAARARRFPDAPTLREVGFDMVATSPYGIAGPKGMAAGVVQVLHNSFKDALNDPAHVAVLDRFDMQIAYLDSEDYATAIRRQYEEEREMVRPTRLAAKLSVREGGDLRPEWRPRRRPSCARINIERVPPGAEQGREALVGRNGRGPEFDNS